MARYPSGQPVRVSVTVTDQTGAYVTPTTITLSLQRPDGTTGTYPSPTADSTGHYHQDLLASDLTTTGHYGYTWTTTGTGAGVSFGSIDVFDPFEASVITLADAKQALNITNTVDDAEIQGMLGGVQAIIEAAIGGPVVNRSISERCEATARYSAIAVRQRPLVSVQSITDNTNGTSVPVTDVEIDTVAGIIRRQRRLPFLSYGPYYTVVYTAGLGTSVPPAIASAARIIIQNLWESQRGPAQRPDLGGGGPDQVGGFNPADTDPVPMKARVLLEPYAQEAYI
jgi:hypothetical protein